MKTAKPSLVALDLEGVLVPEIWIAVAEKTGIDDLRLTTRDVSDYDELMQGRLRILEEHNLTLNDIQQVIGELCPLEGALTFLDTLRAKLPVIILSDTFYEFAAPLMRQLGWPALFCNSLKIDEDKRILDYHLRQKDGKRLAVRAFKGLNFQTIAAGDSYNDTSMLAEADHGILFRASEQVIEKFPQFDRTDDYEQLLRRIFEKVDNSASAKQKPTPHVA